MGIFQFIPTDAREIFADAPRDGDKGRAYANLIRVIVADTNPSNSADYSRVKFIADSEWDLLNAHHVPYSIAEFLAPHSARSSHSSSELEQLLKRIVSGDNHALTELAILPEGRQPTLADLGLLFRQDAHTDAEVRA